MFYDCNFTSCVKLTLPRQATTNTQTNTSGSNTTISGGYSQESTTTYQSGSSSNTTSTTNNNSYTGDTRVANSAPHHQCQPMSQDLLRISGGISTVGVGISGGTYITDENCERIKLSKVLNDLGMKVAVCQYFVKILESSLQWNNQNPLPI